MVRTPAPGVPRRRAAEKVPAVPPLVEALPDVRVARGSVATSPLLAGAGVDALLLPVAPPVDHEEGVDPRTGTADAAARYGIDLGDLAERLGHTGAAGEAQTVELPRPNGTAELPWSGLPARVVLIGVGTGSPADLRRAGAAIARSTRGLARAVTTVGEDAGADGARALVEGYLLGAYRHPTRSTGTPAPGPAGSLILLGRYPESVLEQARIGATATWTARALTVTPSDTKNPAWMAERARELAVAAGLAVEVLGPDELAVRGFGGLLAVGSGSATGPRLVTVRYEPPATGRGARGRGTVRHVVLVGKGITYDTGGLSIKPREAMVPMKTDMAGAAVALVTVLAAAQAGVRHRVTAVLPLAENAFGAASYRPGDVLRVYGGTTVEIANTDAEGRIVLADALSHA
ncbi:MAG TPA: M17 family peptidase N-terminal domain-containing protein, partial [Actinotalea sp.]